MSLSDVPDSLVGRADPLPTSRGQAPSGPLSSSIRMRTWVLNNKRGAKTPYSELDGFQAKKPASTAAARPEARPPRPQESNECALERTRPRAHRGAKGKRDTTRKVSLEACWPKKELGKRITQRIATLEEEEEDWGFISGALIVGCGGTCGQERGDLGDAVRERETEN